MSAGDTAIGTAAVAAVGGPVAGALYLGTDIAAALIGEILAAEPEGDDRPMPIARDASGAYCGFLRPGDLAFVGLRASPGRTSNVHPEFAEAHARLQAVAALARACGNDPREVDQAAAFLVRALNAGISESADGDGGHFYQCLRDGSRPTRGQVRAWLKAFADKMAERCRSAKIARLGEVVGQALDVPADLPRPSGNGWLALLGGAGIAAALWWALRRRAVRS